MSINLEMWQTLLTIDINVLSNSTGMICKNLTFDNPGIFESTRILSKSHRDEAECCNLWLLHRFIYMLSDTKFSNSFDDNLELQRHILAAANLKQPWFFATLIRKYIYIARQLSSADLHLPVSITTFQGDETVLRKICATVEYPAINLNTQADVRRLLKFTVLILEHFISDMTVAEEKSQLASEIVNLFLDIFQQSTFAIKVNCLKFFYRFFKCHDRLQDSSLRLFTQVLQITTVIFRKLGTQSQQPEAEDLRIFDKTLLKLFEVVRVQPIDDNTRSTTFLATCLEFQRAYQRMNASLDHFPKSFALVTEHIFDKGCDFDSSKVADENLLLNHLKSTGMRDLWIFALYLKITCKTEDELKKSVIWKELIGRVSIDTDPDAMYNLMELVHQLSEKFNGLFFFPNGDYETIATTLFQRQTEQMRQSPLSCDLSKHLRLIHRILIIKDASSLDDRTQQQLFDVLVYGLEDLLELKFRPSAGVFQEFYECQRKLKDAQTELLILSLVAELRKDHLYRPTQNKLRLLMENIMKKSASSLPPLAVETFLKTALPELIKNKHIPFDEKVTQFLKTMLDKQEHNEKALVHILNKLICLSAGQTTPGSCRICRNLETPSVSSAETVLLEMFRKLLVLDDIDAQLTAFDAIEQISKHFPQKFQHQIDFILDTMLQPNPALLIEFSLKACHLVPGIVQRGTLLEATVSKLLKLTKTSLATPKNRPLQLSVVRVVREFALAPEFDLCTLLRFFKLLLIFLIRDESRVVSEVMLVCDEVCIKRKFKPKNLFNWYKQPMLEIIVQLATSMYLRKGVSVPHSLIHISKVFGYFGPDSFIYENHPLLLAHLLPFVVKYSECGQMLKDICDVLQKDIATTLANSFLVIFQCLFLKEPDEIHQKCGELITETTGQSVYELLSLSDKTVAMFLIYYHRNPQCVTNTFKCLLAKDGAECSLTQIVEYVSSKFLCVLNFFETNLIQDVEKSIKRDVLLSLGEIIRLMGSKYISQFRFKIVSLLRTAAAVKEMDLHELCAQVWDIFLRTVDVPCLGSLLSTIVVSMEPLLKDHAPRVNSILRYLIISNGNLLSSHLKDLFFAEQWPPIVAEVKQFIVQHNSNMPAKDDQEAFDRLFFNYSAQIHHDNMAVRIYGIRYLTQLFRGHRSKVNRLIMGRPVVDDQVEATLNQLIASCKHAEENLQVAAGVCVGEIGAIEPSYLQQNYAPQKKFCTSILTADFAIATLADLCHAYQFQKNSKHVDSFSLAIQDILRHHAVDPKQNRQMHIWSAIPERMQQIMEPLLTSFYTNVSVKNYDDRHPVFPCRTCSLWANTWASNIIQNIEHADIKLLLNSFKPSLKNDRQIMATLMPYIVLHGLQYSSAERRQKIREEFELIFGIVARRGGRRRKDDETRQEADRERAGKELPMLGHVPEEWQEETAAQQQEESAEDVKEKCAKLAFNLLDFLGNWCSEYRQKHYRELSASEFKLVDAFLGSFDKKTLALANFSCGEYARALQLVEDVVMKSPGEQLQAELSFLGQIYAELLDSDSLEGAMALKTHNLSLTEQILLNNVTGKLNESATCYERMLQQRAGEEEMSVYDMKDMVQCYLGLDQPETALLICEGLMEKLYAKHARDVPNEIAAEPLWRLGRFEEVEKAVDAFQLHDSSNWGVRCGLVLHCLRQGDKDRFELQTAKAREVIMNSLRMTEIGENSYTKGYDQVLKLHLVTEIEKTFALFRQMQDGNYEVAPRLLDAYLGDMRERLELFLNQRNVQTILCLRRILFTELSGLLARSCPYKDTLQRLQAVIDLEMGKSWCMSTRVARKAGATQQASLYILNCERYGMKDLFLEKAKLQWDKGEQTIALQTLNRGMENLTGSSEGRAMSELRQEERMIFSKAKFLLATYNAQSMNIQTDLNVQHFKDSLAANRESEVCFVRFAQFLDKIYENTALTRKGERFELLRDVMTNYGNSMLYGFKYIYQSMPRMLSIWLDYTADKFSEAKMCAVLTKIADGFAEQLPSFMFFTAFSQLASRICHPSQDVYNVLRTILVKLILNFPQQSLWMLLCVLKSSYASRTKKCAMVIDDRRLQGMKKLIGDFNALAVKLIDLSKVEIKKGVSTTTVSALARDLPRIISDHNFSPIIVPCEQFMRPILPSPLDRTRPVEAYVPFPQSMAYIQGVDEEVLVLQSLQKPRRVTFKASNGLNYKLLLKPKDDLRRDFRLMEFNNVVKHYLNLDLQAKERRLNIRSYFVLPLNEEYGIIEWLDNLQTFRQILSQLYKLNRSGMQANELSPYFSDAPQPLHKAKERFVNVFLKRHPPVFDQWFKKNFTTSHNWYLARTAYVRTCGVMSIVGYILGLGDRHCENILFDVTNGENVHVDFNCLFNAGERFGVPERVPFRLTQNMVHAMGPLGIEGPFRKTCEVTLRVMRAQQQTLMSVIRPFIYDPLLTWKKSAQTDGTERTDSDAMVNLQNIEYRLKGFVRVEKQKSSIPLSAEGQVNFVIKEATDINNLAPMYIGWSPFM